MWLIWIAFLIASFLLGSVPSAYMIVKWRTGKDIRELGSGNVGATNAVRAVGKLGYLSFVFDVLKGFLPVFLASRWFGYPLAAACGLCALLGHFFPPWLQFRGGKGVSTAAGIYLALAPLTCLLGVGVWLIMVLAFGYVSLASCTVLCLGPIVILAAGSHPFACFWIFCMIAALVTLRHSSNFRRLLTGTERRSKFWLPNLLKKI